MAEESYDYGAAFLTEYNTKLNDLEERQRLLKERVLLIGQNLIETKDELEKDMLNIKIILEEFRQDIKKIKEAVIRLSDEVDKKARKSEVEILAKQAQMFSPLEFVRIEDINRMIKR